jgi:hypothetical protein
MCDSVWAGPAGANQTWNFSGLTSTGDTSVHVNVPPVTNNPFPLANIAQHNEKDSTYSHLQQTTTATYMWGDIDSSTNGLSIIFSDSRLVIERPFTFGDNAADTFAYTVDTETGSGVLAMEADAYGTLMLPHDTFNNVLRVKTESFDTVAGTVNTIISTTSYSWYADTSRAPLLRIDSFNVIIGFISFTSTDVQYTIPYVQPTSVGKIPVAEKIAVNAHLDNTGLVLNGSLENGKQYELALYSINGQKIFGSNFTANGATQRFAVDNGLASGNYILTIHRKNQLSTLTAIKLNK